MMLIRHYTDIPAAAVEEGASGTTIREMITVREGAPNFAMRLFELAPGGHTPFHAHPWEHEVFILEGSGSLVMEDGTHPYRAGDCIFIPGDEKHQFTNSGKGVLRFICCIPVQHPCDV